MLVILKSILDKEKNLSMHRGVFVTGCLLFLWEKGGGGGGGGGGDLLAPR